MENIDVCVFIFAKDGKIKAFSKPNTEQLKSEGWKHTATLDACRYLEYLHNEEVNQVNSIRSLGR